VLDGDAFRGLEHHRVREAERQAQVLALHRGAVTDADQFKLALEAGADAVHHVGDDGAQGAGQRHQRSRRSADSWACAVFDIDFDAGRLRDR
jgi:hypothetical protein